MEKIKTVSISPTILDAKQSWKKTLQDIRDETGNFDPKQMCEKCIETQIKNYGKQTIKCTGLATMRNTLEQELQEEVSEEFYSQLLGTAGAEALKIAEEYENSYYWIENNIVDKSVFNPRPHQRMINSCTSTKKVLRMGRRCVSQNTVINGYKKNYKAKHLWHLYKNKKNLPYIEAYNDETGELVLTNNYVIVPNAIATVYRVELSNGYHIDATARHPILVYTNKHYHFEEIRNIEVGNVVPLTDNNLVTVKSITKLGKTMTYHLSVLKYHTFVTKGGIIHHNTGKTFAMAIGMLHRLLTRKNYEVLMVAPMVTMINEVVEQLEKFCQELPVNPITRSTMAPINLIEFSTGSTFKGVTAGASGAKGTRGKSADLMYMDECFPPSTKIKMADGSLRAIEEIEEGDYVLSFDEKTNKLVSKKVVAVRMTGKKDIYEFRTVSGKKITCTNNHPIYTKKGWKMVCEADDIATLNTRTGTYFFESILGSRYKGLSKVYNLEVEDTHTYIASGFIVHNCDFLTAKDLNSLLAIMNDNPNVEFWASSTPIGQGNLYKLGSDPSFKEFHFPTYVIDHYNDELDEFNRRNLDEIGYEQEILANYGASEASVFQVKFVDQSCFSDEEVLITPAYVKENRRDFIITMGVDWNRDKVGTRLVIVGYHKPTGRYYILHKDRVAKQGWTQILAINKIVESHAMFDVDHLYVDDGHGETQASLLRMYGQDRLREVGPHHPDARLMDTKAVMFGSSLILRDPVTGEELKKQTKQYMVEHTADLLSRGNLVLLSEADNDIVVQLKNYVVKAISQKGLKTYEARDKQIGDHDLDAYMLALHALHQEYAELAGNSAMGSIVNLLKQPMVESSNKEEDPYAIIGYSTNIVLNTRKSMVENAFRQTTRTNGFKARRKIR